MSRFDLRLLRRRAAATATSHAADAARAAVRLAGSTASGGQARGRRGLSRTFASLRSPNYRLWFAGQLVSLVGSWMQTTAQGFLLFELTGSVVYLGLVGFAAGVPTWILMLVGGLAADRIPRRTLLLVTQTAMAALALILAVLVATDLVRPVHVLVLAFALGVANAFDAPTRQAFVVELVDREDLTNAIALNATMFNSAVVVGPAAAAAVYAALGPAWCFALNGLSYAAVILALWRMKGTQAPIPSTVPPLRQLAAGVRVVAHDPTIRTLVLNLAALSLLGVSVMTIMPAWSTRILHGDVRTNGMLLSARGVGALLGALMIASFGHRMMRGRVWTAGGLVMPIGLTVFALSRWLPLSLAAMVVVGWSFMTQANNSNALVQTRIADEVRGRVMSVYTLVFFGSMPLGALLVGTMAARIGQSQTVLWNAAILAVIAVLVWVRMPLMRALR